MFKYILSASLVCSAVFADDIAPPAIDSVPTLDAKPVEDSFGYFSYGISFPSLINLNLARRSQKGHNGFEVGIGGTPLIVVYEAHGFANYLYYPNPDPKSQFYLGFGAQGGFARQVGDKVKHTYGYAAPNLVIGKSYANSSDEQRLIQLNLTPNLYTGGKWRNVITLHVNYGFAF